MEREENKITRDRFTMSENKKKGKHYYARFKPL